MNNKGVKVDMELISSEAFAQYMSHRGFTVRSLAERVSRTVPCSRATIGHLRSGERKSTSPRLATEIERCLGAPQGSLFVGKVSTVSQDSRRRVVA